MFYLNVVKMVVLNRGNYYHLVLISSKMNWIYSTCNGTN
jgi:hypothetical protein